MVINGYYDFFLVFTQNIKHGITFRFNYSIYSFNQTK
jgi:hypothetical protein